MSEIKSFTVTVAIRLSAESEDAAIDWVNKALALHGEFETDVLDAAEDVETED